MLVDTALGEYMDPLWPGGVRKQAYRLVKSRLEGTAQSNWRFMQTVGWQDLSEREEKRARTVTQRVLIDERGWCNMEFERKGYTDW